MDRYNEKAYKDYENECPICGRHFNWFDEGYDFIDGELVCTECFQAYIQGEWYEAEQDEYDLNGEEEYEF